tara:strand:- start:284 stop:745 length:462 start_codon:yes stop_codon:yes gene_type:complete
MTKFFLIFFLIFTILQFFLLRYPVIKINSLKAFLSVFIVIFFTNIYLKNIDFLFFSILAVYIYFCFIITTPGIKNLGPSIYLIKLIFENSKMEKNKIKKLFLKEKFVEKRLNENLINNFIYKKKSKFYLTNVGGFMVRIFNRILKFFKLHADI